MVLDLIIAAVVLVWAVYGYRKGFIRQIFVLAGIIAVFLGAAPMADLVEEILAKEFDMMLVGRYVRGLLLAGCSATLYITAFIIGRFLQSTLVKGIPVAEKTNHILGTVMAIFASALAVFFILCIFSIGKDKIMEYTPAAHDFISASRFYQIADANNPVQHFDFFSEIHTKQAPKQDQPVEQQNPAQINPPAIPVNEPSNPSSESETQNRRVRPVRREVQNRIQPNETPDNSDQANESK